VNSYSKILQNDSSVAQMPVDTTRTLDFYQYIQPKEPCMNLTALSWIFKMTQMKDCPISAINSRFFRKSGFNAVTLILQVHFYPPIKLERRKRNYNMKE